MHPIFTKAKKTAILPEGKLREQPGSVSRNPVEIQYFLEQEPEEGIS